MDNSDPNRLAGSIGSADDAVRQAAESMVSRQLVGRGIRDERVLQAMLTVPRHRFVPDDRRPAAYRDGPLSIGLGQTISQPYIVALMTELLAPAPTMRVLEIGTGSGYQTAVLARCVASVESVEILPELAQRAAALLRELGVDNVSVHRGDGFAGWPEGSPYDGILVTAAPAKVPEPLLDQLAPAGRLVIPVGRHGQDLIVVRRTERGFERRSVVPVRFVPMTGRAETDA